LGAHFGLEDWPDEFQHDLENIDSPDSEVGKSKLFGSSYTVFDFSLNAARRHTEAILKNKL
ncbi:MAG: hypothetical protein MI866_17145, partial [Bacteroidales bacterium]|nr:hypothetical protein [Bacteroidales bacterium]